MRYRLEKAPDLRRNPDELDAEKTKSASLHVNKRLNVMTEDTRGVSQPKMGLAIPFPLMDTNPFARGFPTAAITKLGRWFAHNACCPSKIRVAWMQSFLL